MKDRMNYSLLHSFFPFLLMLQKVTERDKENYYDNFDEELNKVLQFILFKC